jgi:predicted RNA-binding protein with RPS1 domain
MELTGTVLNVVDFGAFVDIGMHDSGLVHVSQLADKFVRDPHEMVTVGDIVRVWVLEVDKQRRRVSLTMIPPGRERPGPRRYEKPQGSPRPEGGRDAGRPPRPPRPQDRGRAEGQASPPPAARSDRPRFQQRPPQGRPPRAPDRGPPKPPPRPKPVTPITDDMKAGKEPLRSFSDLMQFYGMGHQPGGTEQGRAKKDRDKRGKDAARRKEQDLRPQETQTKLEGPESAPPATPIEADPQEPQVLNVVTPSVEPTTDGLASAPSAADQTPGVSIVSPPPESSASDTELPAPPEQMNNPG